MKKSIIIFIYILISNSLWAQLPDSVLIENYGQIRADMVKTVCRVIGYTDTFALNSIKTTSLTEFKKCITEKDTLLQIISTAKGLYGSNIDDYSKNLNETRKSFKRILEKYYPEKEEEIDNQLNKYIKVIDDLSKECTSYNNDTSESKSKYLSTYKQGRFLQLINSPQVAPSEPAENKDVINVTVHENSKKSSMFSKFFAGFFSVLWFMCKLAVAILAIFMLYIKRKQIVRFVQGIIKKSHRNSMQNNPNSNRQKHNHEQQSNNPTVQPQKTTEIAAEIVERQGGNETETPTPSPTPTPPPYHGPKKEDKPENSGEAEKTTNEANPIPQPTPPQPTIDARETKTAIDAGEWIVVGASVQGNGHIQMNLPCQDCHGYKDLGDGWGIAITSDGAGSAKLSHVGAAITVSRAIEHFKNLIQKEQWITCSELPSDSEWMKFAYRTLKMVRDDISAYANKNSIDVKNLSSTIIVFIHSPYGALVTHIGDGRAGYKDMKGRWHSVITPHKGEEANQTIFIPSEFWNIPFFEMSGATVPESRVIREQISAFTLMSDGCENTSWLCNQLDESTGKFYDPNTPFPNFFNSLLETLQSFRSNNTSIEERKEKWYEFIKSGNKSFVKETDDKTMILGALYM